jgi:hypothetical protein
MTSRIESLSLIHQACWLEVERAAHQREHAFRVMGLATLDGNVADLRSVVIREVDAADRTLVFFTDSRSPKVAQMRAQPLATMLTWCPNLGWQLRLRVRLDVETSGLTVSSRWARLKMTPAAHDYLSPLPPGTITDRFEPERASREHFAVVSAQVLAIDWLELHADGHRRALFDADGNGQWVTP